MENQKALEIHYMTILSRLFGSMDDVLLKQVLEKGKIKTIETGEYLFQQGDNDNSLFIILSGRCRALLKINEEIQMLGDIAEGEPAGEFALFTSEPRTASVVAIRPSVVLELTESEYIDIITIHPTFSTKITNFIIRRLRRNELQLHLQMPPKNIAIINLQPDNDGSVWMDAIKNHFGNMQISCSITNHEAYSDNSELFASFDSFDGINFLVCSEDNFAWSKQCVLYSDVIIVVSDFYAVSNLYDIEQYLELYNDNILNKKKYLVLIHPENGPAPHKTARWLEKRNPDLHIHLRKNHQQDIRRLSRIITNRANGIVLGGGGAKGFAHVGAVQAMLKAGVEIDFLGGTSAGALYGLGMAYCDFEEEKINFYLKKSVEGKLTSNDLTMPAISFLKGKKFTEYLKYMFGTTCMEDLWITTYCISTNYSKASLKIHERGQAWKQILASIAIQGVFPPVIIDKELHVDGGVMDNLPIEPMYRYPVQNIIALALSSLHTNKLNIEEVPSGWAFFWDKIAKKKKYNLPGISSLMINS
ncbi:MAG: patatin-like phospholipase family protein [Saprospiraceae bacterium]|nr:patatin-like phospholipase family protein [Saprospiraceae bacterium]